jgi:DNA processing protein
MMLDHAVALSLTLSLPGSLRRTGLSERLRANDPELLEQAASQLERARDVRIRAASAGISVLAWNDTRFPAALLAITDTPPVIWYRGALDSLDVPAVAIVGSRAASAVALETAACLAADLAVRGIVVVSGLARGVDSAAHRGALTTARTVAVLGSGLDRVYPPEHKALAADIARAGLLVSEHAPGTPPLPFHFPLRNRLISGLSRAVVVIEASDKSGSLITAACALEQGREVMAVPGNVLSGRNRGGHGLIRDGATIVECADDIVEELGIDRALAGGSAAPASHRDTKACADPLLARLEPGTSYDLDGLVELSGIGAARLLPKLLQLELQGFLRRIEGGRFVRPT